MAREGDSRSSLAKLLKLLLEQKGKATFQVKPLAIVVRGEERRGEAEINLFGVLLKMFSFKEASQESKS